MRLKISQMKTTVRRLVKAVSLGKMRVETLGMKVQKMKKPAVRNRVITRGIMMILLASQMLLPILTLHLSMWSIAVHQHRLP